MPDVKRIEGIQLYAVHTHPIEVARCYPAPSCPHQGACARAHNPDAIAAMNAAPHIEDGACWWFVQIVREAA